MAEAIKSTSRDHCKPMTAERARELFDYDPLTGVVICKVRRGPYPAGRVRNFMKPTWTRTVTADACMLRRDAWLRNLPLLDFSSIAHIPERKAKR